jgi:hypothetical protein
MCKVCKGGGKLDTEGSESQCGCRERMKMYNSRED